MPVRETVPWQQTWSPNAIHQSKVGAAYVQAQSFKPGQAAHGAYQIEMQAYADLSRWYERLRAALTIQDIELNHPLWIADREELDRQIDRDTLLFLMHSLLLAA